MPDAKNPGDRVKASRLRRAQKNGQKLQPVDQLWLSEYDDSSKRAQQRESKNYGRSRSARKMEFKLEEAAEAEGTGNAAAAAALAVREEGRRIDSLTIASTDALKEACGVYKDICETLRAHWELMTTNVTATLEALRDAHLSRLDAESTAAAAQGGDRDQAAAANEMVMMLIAKELGIAVPSEAFPPGYVQPPRGPRPPPNGHGRKR